MQLMQADVRGSLACRLRGGAVGGIVGIFLLVLVLIHVQLVKRLLFAQSFFLASKSVQCSELSLIFDELMQGHCQEEPRH
jgi:hypothetical protein